MYALKLSWAIATVGVSSGSAGTWYLSTDLSSQFRYRNPVKHIRTEIEVMLGCVETYEEEGANTGKEGNAQRVARHHLDLTTTDSFLARHLTRRQRVSNKNNLER